ncbi:MAG TPA: hypothetical protein VHH34_23090, partial [Pseudonocardiaceae bacterium]|nr:hypothetical protein [Pseudonocardiaceae bacterium]
MEPAAAATESDLAVLVLQTSWALADAAHDLPAGRLSAQRRDELADPDVEAARAPHILHPGLDAGLHRLHRLVERQALLEVLLGR